MIYLTRTRKNKNIKLSRINLEEFRHFKQSWGFVSISSKDPDCLAAAIREACEKQHNVDPTLRYSLYDPDKKTRTLYGYGTSANNYKIVHHLVDINEDRLKNALTILNDPSNSEEIWAIKKPYDYAWIYKAIKANMISGFGYYSFFSTKNFIEYIKSIGFFNIDKKRTINKYVAEIDNENIFPWDYNGVEVDLYEKKRRNCIVIKFEELMSE